MFFPPGMSGRHENPFYGRDKPPHICVDNSSWPPIGDRVVVRIVARVRMPGPVIRIRSISTILVLAYLAATIGFPISDRPIKTAEDFPCRDHACGCLNADMCRTQCCCFKPTPTKSCCSKGRRAECDDSAVCEAGEAPSDQIVGLVIAPLSCQGKTSHWVAVSCDLGLAFAIRVPAPVSGSRRKIPFNDFIPVTNSILPEVPPPRAARLS